ncbi:sushi, nidogen and EGF-like domain-containing 1 [Pelobates cultripes]|uniref:Sushi, nidogen and EGF-like domain-containing 1 n=1 Tax=Pelobates cultripes TaxID=61616 RepID=A0AAD1WQM9_PELCU|nr:sushi, nidogen and EGF-like domain-containing 1 [Pelobates cultripes]
MYRCTIFVLLLINISWINSTTSTDLFYPYGSALDTICQKIDDGSSPIIYSTTPIPLFGRLYSFLYVNHNGLVSFSEPISQFTPSIIPMATWNPYLAPFWGDVDNRLTGDIYYRQSMDSSLQARATSDIRAYFNSSSFTSRWVFVATWDRVAYYGSVVSQQQTNTFQVVLTTDGNATFVLFNYGTIQWTTGTASGGVSGLGGTPALVGVYSGNVSSFYTLPGSMTSDILNVTSTSNVQVPGRWALEIDKYNPEFTVHESPGGSWVNSSVDVTNATGNVSTTTTTSSTTTTTPTTTTTTTTTLDTTTTTLDTMTTALATTTTDLVTTTMILDTTTTTLDITTTTLDTTTTTPATTTTTLDTTTTDLVTTTMILDTTTTTLDITTTTLDTTTTTPATTTTTLDTTTTDLVTTTMILDTTTTTLDITTTTLDTTTTTPATTTTTLDTTTTDLVQLQ